MDIEQILNLDNKDKVEVLSGTVTEVFERNRNKGRGRWKTVQNFMVEDDTGKIKVAAWDMDDLDELVDQNITLKKDMMFKDDGEYQSISMGRNTKIIEEGATEEKSPRRERKADSRERGKPTRDKTASGSNRNDAIYWQTCLKVAGTIFGGYNTNTDKSVTSKDVIEFTRDLYSARPGSPAQDKVRKLSTEEANEELDEARNDRAKRKATAKRIIEKESERPDDTDGPPDDDDEPEFG